MATASADQQRDAEQLAAAYDYDVGALRFQFNRRSFGSFTTTIAGFPSERDRYFAAWQFAFERQRGGARS
jgi:hypothetical protein